MGTEAALGVTRMPGLYRCLRGTKVGQEGTRGDVGLSNLWVTHQHWEMPRPGWTSPAMGKPVQETRVRWDGMGIHWERQCLSNMSSALGTGSLTPQRPFQKGNAGSCQHRMGMLEQPGLGAHLVLSFGGRYGPWSKSSNHTGLGCGLIITGAPGRAELS